MNADLRQHINFLDRTNCVPPYVLPTAGWSYIKTEPVGKPALLVLFSVLAIISLKEKYVPTKKAHKGSLHLYADTLVLHHCTEEYFTVVS